MLDISKIKALAEMLEDIAAVSDLENRGPMYAGQHIRSGLVKISKDAAADLWQGAEDIRGQFIKMFDAYSGREKQDALLPDRLQSVIRQIGMAGQQRLKEG
jgi:hypothetical protein